MSGSGADEDPEAFEEPVSGLGGEGGHGVGSASDGDKVAACCSRMA